MNNSIPEIVKPVFSIKDAIIHFDEAISIDQSLGGESDPNLLLLKNNSSMKLWLKTNVFAVEDLFKLNLKNVVKKLVIDVTLIHHELSKCLIFENLCLI